MELGNSVGPLHPFLVPTHNWELSDWQCTIELTTKKLKFNELIDELAFVFRNKSLKFLRGVLNTN